VTETFTLEVRAVNSAPSWQSTFSGPYSVDVYDSLTIAVPSFVDNDAADSHTVSCLVGGVQPAWITTCSSTSIVIQNQQNSDAGSYTVIVTVTDDDTANSGSSLSDSISFDIDVEAINTAP